MFCQNASAVQTAWPLEAAGQPQSEPLDAFKSSATLNAAMGQQPKETLFTAAAGGCVMHRKVNSNSRLR